LEDKKILNTSMSEDYFKKYLDEKFLHLGEKIEGLDTRLQKIEGITIFNEEQRRNSDQIGLLKHLKNGVVWLSVLIGGVLGIDKLINL
jgi:hypothetical protein